MSAEDVETVEKLYAGLPADLVPIFADEATLDAWRGRLEGFIHPEFQGGNPDEKLVAGGDLDAFIETWRDWLSAWGSWWVETEDFVPAPDGKVVVFLNIRARSKTDQVEVPMQGANVLTVKDGKVIRLHLYFDRPAALKAAGLAY